MTIKPLTASVHPAGAGLVGATGLSLDRSRLVGAARDLAETFGSRRFDDSDERYWQLVLRTPQLQAWLIVWPPGTGIDLHDHGASQGAVVVLRGGLTERYVRHENGVSGFRLRRLEPAIGVVELPPGHVHAVANQHVETAVSLHVYSPHLTEMNFQRLDETTGVLSAEGPAFADPG